MDASGTAVVTGASRGIGKAVARELAQRGFDVIATMRNVRDGDDLSDMPNLTVAALDVTDPASIRLPTGLRVLVNNAGVEDDNLPVEVMPAEVWRKLFETNVFGLVEVTKQAIPLLRASGGGVICNVTSSSILAPVPFLAAYRSSKAQSAIGESLAPSSRRSASRRRDVPGPIETDMLARPITRRGRSTTSRTARSPRRCGRPGKGSARCTRPPTKPRVASRTRSSTTTAHCGTGAMT